MYYIRHYIIFSSKEFCICNTLEKDFNIHCKVNKGLFSEGLSYTFDIPENHPMIDRLEHILPEETISNASTDVPSGKDTHGDTVLVVYYPVYSEEEYCNAKWLSIRSCFSKVHAENQESVYRTECILNEPNFRSPIGRHRTHNAPYLIKTAVKWGRNFIASSLDEHVLFCNDRARKIFEREKLVGLKYSPVIDKSSGKSVANLYQLSSVYTTLDTDIIPLQDSVPFVCDQCGMRMILLKSTKGRYGVLEGALSGNVDFYQTPPMIAGNSPKGAVGGHSEFIISQRMYQVMRANKIDRNVIFTPLDIHGTHST